MWRAASPAGRRRFPEEITRYKLIRSLMHGADLINRLNADFITRWRVSWFYEAQAWHEANKGQRLIYDWGGLLLLSCSIFKKATRLILCVSGYPTNINLRVCNKKHTYYSGRPDTCCLSTTRPTHSVFRSDVCYHIAYFWCGNCFELLRNLPPRQ